MIAVLSAVAAFGLGVELGRLWMAREHAPHWDTLARRDHKIASLEAELARERRAHRATARKGDVYRAAARQLAARQGGEA